MPTPIHTTPSTDTTTPPLRESTEIQGDVLAGFRKDHVRLLFLAFGDQWHARTWLDQLRTRIATTADVAVFNTDFRRARTRLGGHDPEELHAVWRGISFTHPGLVALIGGEPFSDIPRGTTQEAFAQGCEQRGEMLGDTGESAPEHWLFGAGHTDPVHAVLTVAGDGESELSEALDQERQEIACHDIRVVFEQEGATLPGERVGSEHFGFKDAISQPGVTDFDAPDPGDPDYVEGKPGTRLIPAGDFIVGQSTDHRLPAWLPSWMNDGSFQVVRRLAQDVPGWWRQAKEGLDQLKNKDAAPADAHEEWLAARLLGRWPSGTPVCKAAEDLTDPAPSGFVTDNDLSFLDDLDGRVTPLFCHLRKTNPRDGLKVRPDDAEPLPEEEVVDGRRIIRRGIPYGALYEPDSGEAGSGSDDPRGLVFVCYQADLAAQFEFVQRSWANHPDFPVRDPDVGRDAVIGRDSSVAYPADALGPEETVPLDMRSFVRTEGAVYAFTPSLSALAALAAGEIPAGGEPPENRVLHAPAILRRGDVVSSGKARLRYEDTGELAVRDENEELRWSSGTAGGMGGTGEFRTNGELALVTEDGTTVWTTPTAGNPGAVLVVKTTGDVQIRSTEGGMLWHTDTAH